MRKVIQWIRWGYSYFSYHFAGEDYRHWQCDKMKRVSKQCEVACQRMKHHPGECQWPGEYNGH